MSIQSNLPLDRKLIAMQAAMFSWEMNCKFDRCLKCPCDLKVAVDARAELCVLNYNQETVQLLFFMPKDCKFTR